MKLAPGRSTRAVEDRLVTPPSTRARGGRRRAGTSFAGCRTSRNGVVVMLCNEASETATVVDGRSLPRLIREVRVPGECAGVLSYELLSGVVVRRSGRPPGETRDRGECIGIVVGSREDGLVESTMTGGSPKLRINALQTRTQRDELLGVANLAKGLFSAFRNSAAHEPLI